MKQLVLAAAALGVVGCGSSGKSDMGTDGGAMMETCTPDGTAVALTGRYAVRADLVVNVKVVAGCSGAACIVDNDANSELLLVADLAQSGTSATATVQPCKIVIPPVALKNQPMPVQLTVPDALIASVLPVSSTATLGGSTTCASFDAQPITIALGASLTNAATDTLPNFSTGNPHVVFCGGAAATACASTANPVGPTDKGCVCDQEGDTKPGATMLAKNAPGFADIDQIYVDLRTSVTLAGQVFSGQRIKGKVQGLKLDQNVVGCHRSDAPGVRDCDVDTEVGVVAGFNPAVTQSVNGDSTFVAVPVAAGTTCDQIKAMEATLFP